MAADELRRTATHLLVDALDDVIVLDETVEHHLVRVLRLTSGETVSATDGRGGARRYRIEVRDGVRLEPLDAAVVIERHRPELTIVTAVPKGDRVDWLVQKCTELGVDTIRFVDAERSVVRWKRARAVKQLERLQRIADEALRQSRRVHRVTLHPPRPALDLLGGCAVAEPGGRAVRADDTRLAIGPEGGWSEAELAAASDRVDLGPNILRTETAAVAACALAAR